MLMEKELRGEGERYGHEWRELGKTRDWAEIAYECSEALDWMEKCLFSLTPPDKIVN